MFTGIIEEKGRLLAWEGSRIKIAASKVVEASKIGQSISTNGVCLTIIDMGEDYFKADLMRESLGKTNLDKLKLGEEVNLERAMSIDSRFDGHIVTGHIDGLGEIREIKADGNAFRIRVEAREELMTYIVKKGSIAIDGISLTVADLSKNDFTVSVIPHSMEETNLKNRRPGDWVNLELDIIGKYVEKFLSPSRDRDSNVDYGFLSKNGFI